MVKIVTRIIIQHEFGWHIGQLLITRVHQGSHVCSTLPLFIRHLNWVYFSSQVQAVSYQFSYLQLRCFDAFGWPPLFSCNLDDNFYNQAKRIVMLGLTRLVLCCFILVEPS